MDKHTTYNRITEVFTFLCWGLSWLFPLLNYAHLPEKIAIHYNLAGQADGWGSRETVWILPAIASLLYIALSVLQRFPRVYNYPVRITEENRQTIYRLGTDLMRYIKAVVVVLFSFMSFLFSGNINMINPYMCVVLLLISLLAFIVWYFIQKMSMYK